MQNEIIKLIRKLNGSLVTGLNDDNSIISDNEIMLLKGNNSKFYCIFEAELKGSDNSGKSIDEIINMIERTCVYTEVIGEIVPQLIYAVVLLKVPRIDTELFKDIIKVEENEFFCKKYIMYYTDNELKIFYKWMDKCKLSSFNELVNQQNNFKLFEKKGDDLVALKLMLRMIIKCPFLKIDIRNLDIRGFDEELINQLNSVKKGKEKMITINNEIFKDIEELELDAAVDHYLNRFREDYYVD